MFSPSRFHGAGKDATPEVVSGAGLGGLAVRLLQKILAMPYGAGPRELALMLAAILGMMIAIATSLI